jgi:hypothetical protein
VVIGGLITSTALTLFLLPVICELLLRRREAGLGPRFERKSILLDREAGLRAAE